MFNDINNFECLDCVLKVDMKFRIKYQRLPYIMYVKVPILSIDIEAPSKTYAVEKFISEHSLCVIMDIKGIE